jgi:uncharacterized repeat protein (TIGR03847 family)
MWRELHPHHMPPAPTDKPRRRQEDLNGYSWREVVFMSRELGFVNMLGADAVGQPGQRRFRLFAQSARGSVVMWMEKGQLNNLSLALDRFLAQLTEGQVLRVEARAGGQPVPEGMPDDFPLPPTYDFQVGEMKLGYDERHDSFVLSATPLEIVMGQDQRPQLLIREEEAVSFSFTQDDARQLTSLISAVVSQGRPVCPLCGAPLEEGPHACLKQNGHLEIIRIEGEDDDNDEDQE